MKRIIWFEKFVEKRPLFLLWVGLVAVGIVFFLWLYGVVE